MNQRLSQKQNRDALLWMLFADLNSRFNTLIEECAHLQDTIHGMIGSVEQAAVLMQPYDPNKPPAAEDLVAGFMRPIYVELPRDLDSNYYKLPQRDRAFLNLWNTLGGLIQGLHQNQSTHRLSFEATLKKTSLPGTTDNLFNTEDLYWYLSQRGYFLQRVFGHYTDQLEHAHEKLVQMLESQAGALPHPMLLRRWNSAAYGEFLSEYSRHVNWETHSAIKSLQEGAGYSQPPMSDALTHTWTYQPTSLTSTYNVHLPLQGKTSTKRFSVIRSAYFYLEQPVLLPLLYHECAHINFPSNDVLASCPTSFFGRRLELNRSLRLAKFPTGDESYSYDNFWDHFTEEVWSDAVSVALSGRSYLLALALQLLGKSGETAFNHFKIEDDILYELDRLGRPEYRKYEANYPELTMEYFWEARLAIACDVMLKLCQARASSNDKRAPDLDGQLATSILCILGGDVVKIQNFQ